MDIKDLRFSDPDTGRTYMVRVCTQLRHRVGQRYGGRVQGNGERWVTLLLDRPVLTLELVETILRDEPPAISSLL